VIFVTGRVLFALIHLEGWDGQIWKAYQSFRKFGYFLVTDEAVTEGGLGWFNRP